MRMSVAESRQYSRMVRRAVGTRSSFVTNGWCVGSTITYQPVKEIRLSLFKTGGKLGHRFHHHPQDGRLFQSDHDLDAWLIENGFLVVHYRGEWCPVHRRQHHWCHTRCPGCAVSGGYAYDGCEEAQSGWDAEDWTWSLRTCADCGDKKWEPNWLQHHTAQIWAQLLCNECIKRRQKPNTEVA